jgi:hypothetical protein
MVDFGKGPTLREACRWLQNDEERWNRILDAVERNSVIEGLPPFSEETRARFLEDHKRLSPPLRTETPRE